MIISASPRKNANSDILAEHVANEARIQGASVEKLNLRGLDIHGCTACDACQQSRDRFCVQRDDMAMLYPKLLHADVIVFATPIYFFAVSGQMKIFLDRLYALGSTDDWTALRGKQAAMIFTYADDNPLYSGVMNAYRMFKDAFEFLQIEEVGCLHASCGVAGAVSHNAAAIEAAASLGRRLGA